MADQEKPLPRPPRSRFRTEDQPAQEGGTPLNADQMASAMAAGKFEEYLAKTFKDNEQAKSLARMMMGLSGMGAMAGPGGASEEARTESTVPKEISEAAASGDLKGLVDLLASEHQRRSGEPETESHEDLTESEGAEPSSKEGHLDRETLDQLIRIASENKVSVDWVMARAVKLYVRDYKLTGRI